MPAGTSSKSQRASLVGTFIATSLIAERSTSRGKPFGPSNRAQSTVPTLLRMPIIVTWIPVHEEICPAAIAGSAISSPPAERASVLRWAAAREGDGSLIVQSFSNTASYRTEDIPFRFRRGCTQSPDLTDAALATDPDAVRASGTLAS